MSKLKWANRACGMLLLWAAAAVAVPAQTFTTLHSFDGTDGSGPAAAVIQGTDGNLYGMADGGGANGLGSVFEITPNGTLTTLHSFDSTEGAFPKGGLVQGTDGNFYGTTYSGGHQGDGTVFRISPSGTLKTLHNFNYKQERDGSMPFAALIQGTDGNFYGTTLGGGVGGCRLGCGTVFKITPSGTLTIVHSFDFTDGAYPYGGVVQGTDGDFYGTTDGGGTRGVGTVFKITATGALTTLYSFCPQGGGNCPEGSYPRTGLVQGTDGNFYGTTANGGVYISGTVFKIKASGALTTLHSFNCTDGSTPYGGLVQGTDGSFYGTTFSGGANSFYGTVFKITPSGMLTTLHSFDGTDGDHSYAALVQATNGSFYGTISEGGAFGQGTVYRLSVGLGQFVRTQPTFGTVGTAVNILGSNLTGVISVTFNGTAATFTVVSKSLITTTVPAGATTGRVRVTNSGGTLSSNVPFTVK